MELIDTHTHLYLEQFAGDRDQVIEDALLAGVGKMLLPNIDSTSLVPMLDLADKHPGVCYPMIGLHPGSVRDRFEEDLTGIMSGQGSGNFIAIGEIGIDLYWDKTYADQQKEAFRQQVLWAGELDLPVVIHSRNAFAEIFGILEKIHRPGMRGVFHSFTGNSGHARRAIEMGFLLGINGILTYNNPGLQKIVQETDPAFLLLETDSPFLSPTPHRNRRNESAFLVHVARKMSELKKMPLEEIALATSGNASKLFKLDR